MINKKLQIIFTILIVFILNLYLPFSTILAASSNAKQTSNIEKISSGLVIEFDKDEMVTFLIKFKESANVEQVAEKAKISAKRASLSGKQSKIIARTKVLDELKQTSEASQKHVLSYLEKEEEKGNAANIQPLFIVNGIVVTATKDVAQKVATFSEIEQLLPNETHDLIPFETENIQIKGSLEHIETNVQKVGAPEVWDKGFDGSGIVIATIDSGVQWNHPALKEKYRGYDKETRKVNHTYNWFDAVEGKKTPNDRNGHGTHVTGTIVGSESNGVNQIGVAPGARWVAVKAFGGVSANDADLLEAAQWVLAPTDSKGKERPDLAPDIVNNSWSGQKGKDEWYRDVVKAWIAAGIFPVFAAGNKGLSNPGGAGSVPPPANYPESFAVGSVTKSNKLASDSLRGPSPYKKIKPDVVAQGVSVRSSYPGGGYINISGTSMATPAVSGVVALMKQAAPDLSVDQMKNIIIDTAIPLMDTEYTSSPNNGYGYGLIYAPTAIDAAIAEEGNQLKRIHGYLRYDTAIEVSRKGWDKSDTVILARGDSFADALTGVPLAYKLDAPILLTQNKKLFDRTLREIKRLRARNVVVLGGPKAINEKVITTLKNEGIHVRRISGKDRFETATLIASEVSPKGINRITIANGMDFPDALSAAAHSARAGMPILLTMKDKIPNTTDQAIKKLKVKESIVIGGPTVIGEQAFKKLPNPLRLSGKDRYETNIKLANYFNISNKHMFVATGTSYADALSGAVLAAKKDSTILLVHRKVPDEVSEYITQQNTERITIFGGPVAVNKKVESELRELLK